MAPMRTVAVVFAAQGGMGDVGKFAIMHARSRAAELVVRPIALYAASEGAPPNFRADVKDVDSQSRLANGFEGLSVPTVDIEQVGATEKVCDALHGADAVISCVGNREPTSGLFAPAAWKPARWCARGTQIVFAAMKTKGINRVVLLSSMGFGDDPTRSTALGRFYRCLLISTRSFREVARDVRAMEEEVQRSGFDYLMLRPMGLDPEAVTRHTWALIGKKEDGALEMTISKEDVAACMLQEALEPTIHRAARTIGYKKS